MAVVEVTAPTIEQLPVRVPGRALAAQFPQPVEDMPLTGADEAAEIFAEFKNAFATAKRCPCCDKPLPGAAFNYGDKDGTP